jgi:hypothetical protein
LEQDSLISEATLVIPYRVLPPLSIHFVIKRDLLKGAEGGGGGEEKKKKNNTH